MGMRSDFEPLCTLDAGRFRLPLIQALDRLSKRAPAGLLLVDAAGVTRGAAGAEMLISMVESLKIDCVSLRRRIPEANWTSETNFVRWRFLSSGYLQRRRRGGQARVCGPAPHGPVERISRERYGTPISIWPPSPLHRNTAAAVRCRMGGAADRSVSWPSLQGIR